MFRLLLIALLTFTGSTIYAKNIAKEGAYVLDADKKILESLAVNTDLIFDHVDISGFEVYGPEGLYNFLTRFEIPFIKIDSQVLVENSWGYPTPEQIEAELRDIHNQYPTLTQLIEIGRSIEGRPLLVLKISDNAAIDEIEPEFKYISSMHGDEITGRELMMLLAKDLLENYGKDQQITELINTTEIFIMPSMNPDGSAKRQRGNARYVDLNRDFPDFSTSDNTDDPAGREPETQSVMKFQAERQFALSHNFHGGAEVVNYPWDTVATPHPFYDLIVELATDYANRVSYIKNSYGFNNGITNGYEWYEVNGGMQDWSYHWYNDLQFTIELSNAKWPSFSKIPYYYEQNREAMIKQIQYIHMGAGFHLDQPGVNGTVRIYKVLGNAKEDLGEYAFRNSEFYKVLVTGEYSFEILSDDLDGPRNVFVAVERPELNRGPNYIQIQ